MSKFLRNDKKPLMGVSGSQINGSRQMNGQPPMGNPQMNRPLSMNGQPPMVNPQINMNRPMQMNGQPPMGNPQMNRPRPVQQINNQNQISANVNHLGRPLANNDFRPMNVPAPINNINNIPRPMNMGQQPIINPNQMNTGMLQMNSNMMNINNSHNTGMLSNLSRINNPIMPQQSMQNFSPITTGMLNLNTGEFIPTPQMRTGMLNLNTGEFIPTPQNTGMLNLNTGEFIPTPQNNIMNTGMINSNVNPSLIQRNNPFFNPLMNTYEFDLQENQGLIGSNNSSKKEIDSKLEELQRMYNGNLISDDEYLIKKRDLVKKALDNL